MLTPTSDIERPGERRHLPASRLIHGSRNPQLTALTEVFEPHSRHPQVGFSAARRLTSARTPPAVERRPGGRVGRGGPRRATRRQCQPRIVPGVTSMSSRRAGGSRSASAAMIARSAHVNRGRPTWRCNAARWWRNTKISASFACVRTGQQRQSTDQTTSDQIPQTQSHPATIPVPASQQSPSSTPAREFRVPTGVVVKMLLTCPLVS
jgi:hypothetical protein